MTGNKIRVALVDDHSAVRAGFRLLLESTGEIEVVAEMDSGEAINQQIGKLEAGANGYITKSNAGNVLLEAIKAVVRDGSWIEPKLKEQMILSRNMGVGTALGDLSRREFQIFCKFAEGLSVQEIADELSLSTKTVANYQTQIKEKLGINTTADLVKLALANGVIEM